MSQIFQNIFSKYQCRFRKGFTTQQYLLEMLENWKRSVNNSKIFIALLIEISKTFPCLGQRNEEHHDLRQNSQFTIPSIRTLYHGSESILFQGPKTWKVLPDRLKNANSIEAFKMKIKKRKPENCSCRLFKFYVQNVSFV